MKKIISYKGDFMKLKDGNAGAAYIVEKVCLALGTERRLEALGLLPGTRIIILNKKSHGALIIFIRGTRFAIGRGIADKILVREEAQA